MDSMTVETAIAWALLEAGRKEVIGQLGRNGGPAGDTETIYGIAERAAELGEDRQLIEALALDRLMEQYPGYA